MARRKKKNDMALIIGAVAVILSLYKGLSWTIVIVAAVVLAYNFLMEKTRLGRHIYGVGGNAEAARLAGIDVEKIRLFAFCSMGLMTALGGILFASRMQAASTTAGAGFELDAIASCYIGGAATSGGSGTIIGAVIGAFIMGILNNGMSLAGYDTNVQKVVKGMVLLGAVTFDLVSKRKKK
mgnify:CR=1 FL=1